MKVRNHNGITSALWHIYYELVRMNELKEKKDKHKA